MKVKENIYGIELTEKEISIITAALQVVYKDTRDAIKDRIATETDDPKEMTRLHRDLDDIRAIRNDFSNLINVSFMGEDA